MNDPTYELYKTFSKFIERAENCCDKDHSSDEFFVVSKSLISNLDAIDKGYAERYEKEKVDEDI